MNEVPGAARPPMPEEEPLGQGPPVDNSLELREGLPDQGFKMEPFAHEVQNGDRLVPVDFAMTQYGFVYGPCIVTRRISDPQDGWVMIELGAKRDVIHVKVSRAGNVRVWQNGKEITSKKAKAAADRQKTFEDAQAALEKAVTEAQATMIVDNNAAS